MLRRITWLHKALERSSKLIDDNRCNSFRLFCSIVLLLGAALCLAEDVVPSQDGEGENVKPPDVVANNLAANNLAAPGGQPPPTVPPLEPQPQPEQKYPYCHHAVNGHIVIADPADDPYLPIFESNDPCSLFYRGRPNFFGEEIPDEWDFYNIIGTNRSDFTDTTFCPGKGVTIIESGYTFHSTKDGQTSLNKQNLPEFMYRYGITNELEFRFKWDGPFMDELHDLNSGDRGRTFGASDPIVSFLYEIRQQDVFIPMVTFLGGTTIPAGTNGFSSYQLQPYSNLIFGWGIRRWLFFKYMIAGNWTNSPELSFSSVGSFVQSGNRQNASNVTNSCSLLFQASKRVGGFMEWFALDSTGALDNQQANFLHGALFLYATPNVQFDIRYAHRLGSRVDEMFAGAGFSVRY